MKSYEIRIGSIDDNQKDSQTVVVYNDRRYNRLSDAAAALQGILDVMASDKDLVDDDLCFWIIRNGAGKKKGRKGAETEIVQVVCGNDEESSDFCYEGMYFLSNCSDFEKMILVGDRQNAWIGDYGVRIESGNQGELCFYSDLDMILESIRELLNSPKQIVNRLMTILRRTEDGGSESIGQLLYAFKGDRSLVLRSRVDLKDDSDDQKALEAFIDSIAAKAKKAEEIVETAEETAEQTEETAEAETAEAAGEDE